MGRCGFFCGALLVGLCAQTLAVGVRIVEDGKSDFTIVTREKPSPAEQLAANELQKYLAQLSGATLQIIPAGKTPPAHAIELVLEGDAVGPSQDESWEIKTTVGRIQIFAHGTRGILFATYQFLDSLGCRFLAPALAHYKGSAEFVPKQPSIEFDGTPMSAKPDLAYRKLYVEEGHSHDIESLKAMAEWMAKVGYNVLVIPTNYQGHGRVKWDNWREAVTPELQKRGLVIEVGGHGYQNFLNSDMEGGTLFTKHPAWFGTNEQGERVKDKGRVFCTSSAEAVTYLINNFIKYVEARPEIQIYDFWPPDGAKWCVCAECGKLGTPSDRQAILVHQVKEAVKPVRPDLRMEVLAYHTSIMPPEHATLDADILLDYCPISQQFDYQIDDPSAEKNAEYVSGLLAWRRKFVGDISVYSYYRKYAWNSLPIIIPHYMQKDLQWYATVPTQGISTYAEPGDWFSYELNHYALAKLAWNLKGDVDSIENTFITARYHSAAPAAEKALTTLENVVRTHCNVPYSTLKSADAIAIALSQVRTARAEVATAEEKAQDPAVKHNLHRLADMCDYAIGDLDIQLSRANKEPAEQILPKVAALFDALQSHEFEGVVLMQRLSLGRLQKTYGVGKGN